MEIIHKRNEGNVFEWMEKIDNGTIKPLNFKLK